MRRSPDPTARREAAPALVRERPLGTVNRTEPAAAFWASRVRSVTPSVAIACQTGSATPVSQADVVGDRVDEPVHPRNAVRVGPFDAGQPKRGPFDGDSGVPTCELNHGRAGLGGQLASPSDDGRVEVQLGWSRGLIDRRAAQDRAAALG
jgi:hypothetical protein